MAQMPKSSQSGSFSLEPAAVAATSSAKPIIFVLDDDAGVRRGLSNLLSSAGMQVVVFSSAAEFLRASASQRPACLILDLQLPDISGLDLQRELAETGGPPIVFISGHSDIPTSVRAMKAGAVEFLPKPFSDVELLTAIESAINRGREQERISAQLAQLRKSYGRLSVREREVLPFIVAGLTNKHSAEKLGIAEITVQVHRAQIMRKMNAPSLPDLVRMAGKLGIC
jgi:FixJ family two-component response regulator